VAGPFGAAAASSRTRVTVGPGGGYYATTTQRVARTGPTGTATAEARRVAYTSGGVYTAGTAYFRAVSAEGRSYTYIDRTGLTGDPYGAVHTEETRETAAGPLGTVTASSRSRVTVGPDGGTTVQASRVAVGSAGAVRTRSAAYFHASAPPEESYTHVERTSVVSGPYAAVHTHEVHATTTAPPLGAAAVHHTVVAVARVSASPAVVVAHSTRYVGASTLRTQGACVREAYSGITFTPLWYRRHPAAWRPVRWRTASIWVAPPWPVVARLCAVSGPPVPHDFGSTIVIEGADVYLDGTRVTSAIEYAEQALAIADAGRQVRLDEEEEWQPLGVFGLIQGDEQEPRAVLQLAVNKDGILRGNYYDALADNSLPVFGAVDRETQRAAWSVGAKKTVVIEAGLPNLTQRETTALVHHGATRTRQMMLVRVEPPSQGQPPQEQPPQEQP
jgi:hypothetical protein